MRCPICGNLFSSGRCPHSLSDRSNASNNIGRIIYQHQAGQIDISQATKSINQIQRKY